MINPYCISWWIYSGWDKILVVLFSIWFDSDDCIKSILGGGGLIVQATSVLIVVYVDGGGKIPFVFEIHVSIFHSHTE